MSRKITTAALAVALLGAVYLGSSWWLGSRAQAQHDVLLAQLRSVLGPDAVIQHHYERGLRSARSSVTLRLNAPPIDPQAPWRLTLDSTIQHGPLLDAWRLVAAQVQTRISAIDGPSATLRQAFVQAEPPELTSEVGFDGSIRGTLILPAGRVADPAQPSDRVQWQTLRHEFSLPADASMQRGRVQLPQLSVHSQRSDSAAGPRLELGLAGLDLSYELQLADAQWPLLPGWIKGRIATLELTHHDADTMQPLTRLRELQLHSEARLDNGLLQGRSSLRASGSMGGIELQTIEQDSEIERIDAAALHQIQQLLATKAGTRASRQAKQALDPALRQLLARGPAYRGRLSASHAEAGQAEIECGLAVDAQPADAPAALAALPWQLTVLQRLRIDARLQLPKAWLPLLAESSKVSQATTAQLEAFAQQLVQKGWLQDEGERYVAQLQSQGASLQLNGRPFNPLQLPLSRLR